jgi:hypothetical protein
MVNAPSRKNFETRNSFKYHLQIVPTPQKTLWIPTTKTNYLMLRGRVVYSKNRKERINVLLKIQSFAGGVYSNIFPFKN